MSAAKNDNTKDIEYSSKKAYRSKEAATKKERRI